ncbi:uncharacterized protein LOC135491288 isoform X2 [Lineus longissimus]
MSTSQKSRGRKRQAAAVHSKKTAKQPKLEAENDIETESKYFVKSLPKPEDNCTTRGHKTKDDVNPSFPSPLKTERINEQAFYDKPCLDLAKDIIGKLLVRRLDSGERVSGLIVETEAYTGSDDIASHSYKGKTERNTAMFMDPGTAYVYFIYGSYSCMNISSRGDGAAVLLRALAPVEGVATMRMLRNKKGKAQAKPTPVKDLCNGPSKFCMALDITKAAINKLDMMTSNDIWLEEGVEVKDSDIVTSTRIGIDGAGKEAAAKPWRFYLQGNDSVSKRDKKAEESTSKKKLK